MNGASSGPGPRIFSIGYEGKPLDAFISILKQNGVERLIDVRDAPFSRKPGFSKKPLEQALKGASIEYIGIPELGTDKDSRDRYSTDADMPALLEDYRQKLGRNETQYGRLKALAQERPSAIMCFEADFRQCHRQAIEERLEDEGFRVVHIGGAGRQKPPQDP